ncbi:anti-sigma regulatory factor (Ser/Thr protein kinase) [Saccharomonospora marina XMU15]|uniref:Anti-sigma regulatory factor (Ser/Thr protein kinase) n=1 Tax=Saccharomonospora marina XMU15 TaxID=882083 RepID=H5XAV1_9PSEU|nr:anti-sigma regulatory factor [Saccharomonospora marina]EHR52661.1 anti-sigma regulatory factor (Ser/Thr protein kinase) [Saccharomonospora marina XMU15]
MTSLLTVHEVHIRDEVDIVQIRQAVREVAVSVGFSLVEQTKLVTAASELARNTLKHGGGGTAEVELEQDTHRATLRLVFRDEGPGIADVELALTDGYSTAGGLGLGLTGARRLADEFELKTEPGQGTTVIVGFHTGRAAPR